jgi:hypothetical protein
MEVSTTTKLRCKRNMGGGVDDKAASNDVADREREIEGPHQLHLWWHVFLGNNFLLEANIIR